MGGSMACRVSVERRALASAIGRLALLVSLFNLAAVPPASAASFVAFGPQTFVRNTGAPVVRQVTFTVLNPSAPYAIEIDNAGIASAIIRLNGQQIFSPSDFNRNATRLVKAVSLAASNVLSVELRSAPGRTLTIRIVGQDTDPPVIQPLVTPGPNVYGWHNTNVSVAFTCTDPTSGIAVCPQPVSVTAEGANQIVSATGVDKAGNTLSVQVTLNIDKTAPVLVSSASPNANASGWNNTPVAVTFAATDALSGVVPTSLSLPVILTADGTNLSASGQATDLAGNTGSVTRGGIRIDQAKPVVTASLDQAPNPNGWNRTEVTVHFTCADGASGVAVCPSAQTVSGDGANQTVSGTAFDNAGNMATAAASVSIYSLPPVVHLTSPTAGTTLFTPSVLVQGTVTDDGSGIASVTCNNAPATTATGHVECNATLTPGANSISVESTDMAGNTNADAISLTYARVPKVTMTSPANQSYLNTTPTTVTGTVDDPDATITINSLPAPVAGGAFTLALPLAEGPNIITAAATAPSAVGTSSIEVTLDTTPPHVTITSPADNFVTADASISIAGNVNDLVVGTVNDQQA